MCIAVEDLKLDRLWVLHPAEAVPYALADKVEAYPLRKWTTRCLEEG